MLDTKEVFELMQDAKQLLAVLKQGVDNRRIPPDQVLLTMSDLEYRVGLLGKAVRAYLEAVAQPQED